MKEPLWLSRALILAVHDRLLADYGGRPGLRDEGLSDSALGRLHNPFAYGKSSIFELAASYAVGIVKNYPFIDGNKRTGFLAAAAFLDSNGFELTATEVEATLNTLGLAAGDVSEAQYAAWLEECCASTDVEGEEGRK